MSLTHVNFKSAVAKFCIFSRALISLSKHLWECDVPLLVCRSIGFLGYIRLQIREHTVIEAHPDNESPDLRVNNPWPALQDYLDSIDIEQLDQKERSHVPPLVILYYYLKKYKDSHGGESHSVAKSCNYHCGFLQGCHRNDARKNC